MTVLIGRHDCFLAHETGRYHPERADRLEAVLDGIAGSGVTDALVEFEPRRATLGELALVHDPSYADALEKFCADGGGHLDADTVASSSSYEAALMAAGAGLDAAERLRPARQRRPSSRYGRRVTTLCREARWVSVFSTTWR